MRGLEGSGPQVGLPPRKLCAGAERGAKHRRLAGKASFCGPDWLGGRDRGTGAQPSSMGVRPRTPAV